MKTKKCNCHLCKLSERIKIFISKIPTELQKEGNDIFDCLLLKNEELSSDLGITNSKIEGIWPKDKDKKYFTRINKRLYEIKGILINESLINLNFKK